MIWLIPPPHVLLLIAPFTAIGSILIGVDCKERERLTVVYLNACARTIEISKVVGNFGTAEWREATKGARAICEAALVAL